MRYLAIAMATLLLVYVGYLAWRIADERQDVAARIDAIVAGAAQDELALPARRIDILFRIEDPTFRTNNGIDLSTPGAGMTSLSQAVGKFIFFDDFEPGLAKGELMALTRFALVPMVGKEKLLRAFVARAYLGSHRGRAVTGFADGARTWFGKPLGQLTEREYLGLVAMLVSPDGLKPGRDDAEREDRINRIEKLLAGRCEPKGLRDVMLAGCA